MAYNRKQDDTGEAAEDDNRNASQDVMDIVFRVVGPILITITVLGIIIAVTALMLRRLKSAGNRHGRNH